MLLKLIRFIRGYVDFKASGKYPERFLNITSRYGINLWNAHPTTYGLEASMYVSDYRKIRTINRKSKVVTKIISKHGLPFFTAKYKSRIGIPIGAVAGMLLLIILSNFIWSIDIVGSETVSNVNIVESLKENGVAVGKYKKNIDVQQIERTVMREIHEIGWMSVNIIGNVVSVEIKEKAQKPEIDVNTTPSNVKAKCDGVITKINAKNGTPQVLIGSGAVKGDLLVSGITETKLNTIHYVHANAEVYADVISNKEIKLAKEFEYTHPSGNIKSRKRFFFLWSEVPYTMSFSSYDNSVCSHQKENLFCNNVILPVGIKTQNEEELIKEKVKLNKSQAERIFTNSMLLYEAFEKGECKVKNRKITIKSSVNSYDCNIDYLFNENIAETVEFSVTE